jgi:hypothetical protein
MLNVPTSFRWRARERKKLPQARFYLKSAQWGFDDLLSKKLTGSAYGFYLIGIHASLRAIQHALKNHDSTLSGEHKRAIEEWWQKNTLASTCELRFIQTSRNLILKEGRFTSFSILTESGTGEGANLTITSTDYELVYYDDAGERHDLAEKIREALRWCDRELAALEAKLPQVPDSE